MKYQFFTYLCIIVINLKIPVIAQQPRYPIPSEDRERYNKKIIPSRLPYGPNTSAGILKETQVNFREASLDTILKTIKASAISPGTGSISLQTSLAPRDNVAAKLPASESTCFRLSKDILFTSTTGSDPFNAPTGNTTSFAVINNVSYFSADDYIHGRELWRSDGTEAGTYLVKDIIPGVDGYVQNIVAANGLLYFAAYTKENGMEPWVSDGTEAGTHLLKDIKAGTDLSYLHPPGFSLHEELVLLVESGLTPGEALRAATLNPARLFPTLESGSIEPGKRADLVLLDGNPLDDIRNTQRINAVVLRGKYLNRKNLDGLLSRSAELALDN